MTNEAEPVLCLLWKWVSRDVDVRRVTQRDGFLHWEKQCPKYHSPLRSPEAPWTCSHNQAYVLCPCKKVLWSNPSDVGSAIHEETAFFKTLWLQCVYHEFAFRNIHPVGKFPLVILRQGTVYRG